MIIQQLTEQLTVLKELLTVLKDEQYTHRINFLNDSTIGAHTRHIIELIQCLTKGYPNGKVDYINRERNLQTEQIRALAIKELTSITIQIKQADKKMELMAENQLSDSFTIISTTYFREIEYNKEHTIHHLALIKVALREMNLSIVNESFGVAYSTLKYLSQQQVMES